MKIGFMGLSSCGKTTLVFHLLEENVVHVPFLPSCVRKVAKEHNFQTSEDFLIRPTKDVYACQHAMFLCRLKEEVVLREFISDRTLLDIFLHTVYRCVSVIPKRTYRKYQRDVYESLQTYNYLFYVESPPIIKTNDPLRITDQSMRAALHVLYYDWITSFNNNANTGQNVPIRFIEWNTVENRVKRVKRIIEE